MDDNASDASSRMIGSHSVFCGDCQPPNQKLNQTKKKRYTDFLYNRFHMEDNASDRLSLIKAEELLDCNRRQNHEEKIKLFGVLVPDCSNKVTGLVPALDEISNYVWPLERQVEELTEHKKLLKAGNKKLNDEITMLKEKIGFLGNQIRHQSVSLHVETVGKLLDHHGANSEAVDKILSMELSASHSISNGDAAIMDFLTKLDADEVSTVELSDFPGLDGERSKVGKYSVPPSLVPTVENINAVYGDVSASCNINPRVAESVYIMFCASIKEMSDLRLEQVTEDLILKWRDAIKDASRVGFNVAFAMEHLKKIACAYIGLTKILKLEDVVLRIFDFESESSAATEEINDKPVSPGEPPIIDKESVDGGDDFEIRVGVENKFEMESKLQLALEAGLRCIIQSKMQMKEVLRSYEVALQDKVKEYEMLKRMKLDLLAKLADSDKFFDDWTVLIEAIEKNNMETVQKFDEKKMKDSIKKYMTMTGDEACMAGNLASGASEGRKTMGKMRCFK